MITTDERSAALANRSSSITPKTPESFIMQWHGFLTQVECNRLIELYEFYEETGYTSPAGFGEIFIPGWRNKNDTIFMSGFNFTQMSDTTNVIKEFWDKLGPCIEIYKTRFGEGWPCKRYKGHDMKAQKISPGGGYHVWHSEWSTGNTSRVLAWMVYLNDMPEGEAETEFLYQGVKVQPKAGTLLIWPSGFTHVHRGNPVYTQDKYQITGWLTAVDDA